MSLSWTVYCACNGVFTLAETNAESNTKTDNYTEKVIHSHLSFS